MYAAKKLELGTLLQSDATAKSQVLFKIVLGRT